MEIDAHIEENLLRAQGGAYLEYLIAYLDAAGAVSGSRGVDAANEDGHAVPVFVTG